MDLFCYASRTVENIWLGVQAGRWAVPAASDVATKMRRHKARKHLAPGSRGLLYCNPTHSFTAPFIVTSEADPVAVVTDIWPGQWVLPFHIEPLGDPSKQLSMEDAWKRWPILKKRPDRSGGVSAVMHMTGITVFVPVDITDEDWDVILEDLAFTPTDQRYSDRG